MSYTFKNYNQNAFTKLVQSQSRYTYVPLSLTLTSTGIGSNL